jgi:hypothetical protein
MLDYFSNQHRRYMQFLKHSKRAAKLFWQRRTRGFDDSETWSFDHSIAKLILPRLKRFKEVNIGIPSDLTEKEWQSILDKMIAAFEFAASDRRWDAEAEEYNKCQEGIDLFARYYFSLWW